MHAHVLELHQKCSAALKDAFELGCALAEAMDLKAVRIWYGRPVFEPETHTFRTLLECMLDRRKMFWTGGARLRTVLDEAISFHADVDPTLNTTCMYFGWKYTLKVRMNSCTWMTMADAIQVRAFADRLDAALGVAFQIEHPDSDNVLYIPMWSFKSPSEKVVLEYRDIIRQFREAYRDFCAVAIQRAWRRARDTPGFAVWRRRMLAEFHDMQTMLV